MAKKNRLQLQELFKTGAKPSQQDFADFIDSTLNIQDDGIEKPAQAGTPLKIMAQPGTDEKLLDFYTGETNTWSINQKAGDKQGLNISNSGGSKLFIDSATGNVGIGTSTPEAKLQVINTNQGANGNTLILGPQSQSNLRLGYHQNYSWIQSHGSKPLAINPIGNNVGIGIVDPGSFKLNVEGGDTRLGGNLTVTGAITGEINTANITSGVLNVDRLPNLSADKITTGTLNGSLTVTDVLKIQKDVSGKLGPILTLQNGEGVTGAGAAIDFNGYDVGTNDPTARIQSIDDGSCSSHIAIYTKAPGDKTNNLQERLRIQANGNVGIGTTTPTAKLEVNGSVQLGGFTDGDTDEWPKVTWYKDTSKNWDEGLLKHSSSRGIFKKAGYGIHLHETREFGLWSTGWKPLLAVEGGTGNTYIKGDLNVKGVLSGAANGYQKAQFTLSGGGTVTWGGSGQRLKWTKRFIGISMEKSTSFPAGYININPPNTTISAEKVHDGVERDANADGVVLKDWEALYAEHTVNGKQDDVSLRIVHYTHEFEAPSNWLLVAVVNGDDKSVKLGTGTIIPAGEANIRFDIHSDLGLLDESELDRAYEVGSSDVRLKTDIENEGNILSRLMQLEVKNYRWKDDPHAPTKKIGFIAQDVQPLFPYLVGEMKDQENDEKTLTLKYGLFSVLAVGALRELKQEKDAEINALKTEIQELKINFLLNNSKIKS